MFIKDDVGPHEVLLFSSVQKGPIPQGTESLWMGTRSVFVTVSRPLETSEVVVLPPCKSRPTPGYHPCQTSRVCSGMCLQYFVLNRN